MSRGNERNAIISLRIDGHLQSLVSIAIAGQL